LFGIARMFALARSQRYDVIHVHWPLPQIIFGLVGKWVCGARLVATAYGVDMRMAKRMPPVRWVLRWMMQRADALIATSPIVAREVAEVTACTPRIIPYWITIPPTIAPRASASHLLAVGRLVERKGYDYLIRALALLPCDLNARLTLVGEGHEFARLEALCRELGVAEHVTWLSNVPDIELARVYDSCDVFVHSSIVDRTGDTESVGMVLLEAMSHARPIVATNVGGIPDVIEDGVTGLLVPEKNPQALADAIMRVLRDDALAQRLGAAARARVCAQVNWDQTIDDIIAVYAGADTP
jgi:glycosyltransferase involved in cell wall biosynthesis